MAGRSFFAWRMVAAAETQDQRNYLRAKRAEVRKTFLPLYDLGEVEFQNRYRLTKEAFIFLCEELEQLTTLKSTQQVSLEEKVLIALFFYACGEYQRPVGVAKNVCQKTVSNYIKEVTEALNSEAIIGKYICFPQTPLARQAISSGFYTKYGIPGVIGCIDGTHFRIFKPPNEDEHLYYCRKHYHSLNVQMVCDSEYNILNVNAKFGGANHDAFIWENSQVSGYMRHLHQQGIVAWLLADSGYPQRPWLMTPFAEANLGSPEEHYNTKHSKARVVIENTFGRLKNRWRCVSKERVLHYKPAKCAKIIKACCVLHNFAKQHNVLDDFIDVTESEPELHPLQEITVTDDLLRGRAYRSELVTRLQHLRR